MKQFLRKIKIILTVSVIYLAVIGCNKPFHEVPPSAPTEFTMQFNLTANGKPITMDEIVAASPNRYSIDLLRFYLGFPRLVKADSTEVPLSNLKLVSFDQALPYNNVYGNVFSFLVPDGNYVAIRFGIGVPPAIKDTIAHYHFGLLDPLSGDYGAHWDMTINVFRNIVIEMFTDTSKKQDAVLARFMRQDFHILEDGGNPFLNLYKEIQFKKNISIAKGENHIQQFNLDANLIFYYPGNEIDMMHTTGTDMQYTDINAMNLGMKVNDNFAKAITIQ